MAAQEHRRAAAATCLGRAYGTQQRPPLPVQRFHEVVWVPQAADVFVAAPFSGQLARRCLDVVWAGGRRLPTWRRGLRKPRAPIMNILHGHYCRMFVTSLCGKLRAVWEPHGRGSELDIRSSQRLSVLLGASKGSVYAVLLCSKCIIAASELLRDQSRQPKTCYSVLFLRQAYPRLGRMLRIP